MALSISNRLAIRNPITEEVQKEYLSDFCCVIYHLEITDYDICLREQFTCWDDLVKFIAEAPMRFGTDKSCMWSPHEFKIWTEIKDFSEQIQSISNCSK